MTYFIFFVCGKFCDAKSNDCVRRVCVRKYIVEHRFLNFYCSTGLLTEFYNCFTCFKSTIMKMVENTWMENG